MSKPSAYQIWQEAHRAVQAGELNAARKLLVDGTTHYSNDPAMHNSAGSLFQKMGDNPEAEQHFRRALELNPDALDVAINHAISLTTLGHYTKALVLLKRYQSAGSQSALYASTMGMTARGCNLKDEAAQWYDRALALEPNRPKALHGRARVALERGEDNALLRFETALSVNNGDADLWLGKAQALDVAGDVAGARSIAESLATQIPQWGEGLRFLAQLRLAAGEQDFTSHYGEAARRLPQDPNIHAAWSGVLAGLDFNEEASEVAARGAAAFPHIERFRFLEANYSGAAGDNARADAIYASLEQDDSERWLHEARHRIRQAEFTDAAALLERVLIAEPDNIAAWALSGLIWRVTDDPKAVWLHEQINLVRLLPLINADSTLPNVVPTLHRLHDNAPLPLGQSLRGGTQTRGHLFDRTEIPLRNLKDVICETVLSYQRDLPAQDNTHPLLRHRDREWSLAGSWSVRLSGGGDHHISHIHPQGIVSSALYLELPKPVKDDAKAGWLELGRPPPDLQLDLEPLHTIEPKVGHMALFPSTLYHGTRPFLGQRRMTTAFDVTLAHPHSKDPA